MDWDVKCCSIKSYLTQALLSSHSLRTKYALLSDHGLFLKDSIFVFIASKLEFESFASYLLDLYHFIQSPCFCNDLCNVNLLKFLVVKTFPRRTCSDLSTFLSFPGCIWSSLSSFWRGKKPFSVRHPWKNAKKGTKKEPKE